MNLSGDHQSLSKPLLEKLMRNLHVINKLRSTKKKKNREKGEPIFKGQTNACLT